MFTDTWMDKEDVIHTHTHTYIHNQILLLLLSRFSRIQLCDPIDGSPLGSGVPGILQARTLEWVAISFSNAWKWKLKEAAQSCPTGSDPMDCSLPGSSVHGIFEARVLECGVIAFSNNQILLSHKKKQSWVICGDMGEPRACHTRWSKSEKQTSYINM